MCMSFLYVGLCIIRESGAQGTQQRILGPLELNIQIIVSTWGYWVLWKGSRWSCQPISQAFTTLVLMDFFFFVSSPLALHVSYM